MTGGPPSIRSRLANALLIWTIAWGLGIALTVGYVAQNEVDELLDESLQTTATLLREALAHAPAVPAAPTPSAGEHDFAWQFVAADGAVLHRTANAPAAAFASRPRLGLASVPGWRIFGSRMDDGRVLYVAHAQRERIEARTEAALGAVFAALSVGLLGHVWLRMRVRRELQPLERLSERLARHDPLDPGNTLGEAERAELAPMHAAVADLGRRLAHRVAHERAFGTHAAHALRTPLAGMDAQLAVALRESPPAVQQRLQRVRDASGRLQRVVKALLDLFRAGAEVQRTPVELRALLRHLPVEGLEVQLDEAVHALSADADLLAAALANLLDNAHRHGARRVILSTPAANRLRVHDDGPGVAPERRRALQQALEAQSYAAPLGLGLSLVDLVARSHGGNLTLPEVAQGFAVEVDLGSA